MDSSHSYDDSAGFGAWCLFWILVTGGITLYYWLSGQVGGLLEALLYGLVLSFLMVTFVALPLALLASMVVSLIMKTRGVDV